MEPVSSEPESNGVGRPTAPPAAPDALDLIRRAIGRLAANNGEPWVLKAVLEVRKGSSDQEYRIKEAGGK